MTSPPESDELIPPPLNIASLQGPQIKDSNGSYKRVYRHAEDPQKLVMRAEVRGSWKKEYPDSNEWSAEHEYHYYCLMFYARRLAHRLKPEFFPDCYLADPQTLVVQNMDQGEVVPAWSPKVPIDKMVAFKRACNDIGLNAWTIDTEGLNFVLTENTIYYVDDLMDVIYFRHLGIFLRTGSIWGDLPPEEREKKEAQYQKMGATASGPRIFSQKLLYAAIEKTFPPDNESMKLNYWGTRQLAQRFFGHVKELPQMPLLVLGY